jgi:O-antigen ligase
MNAANTTPAVPDAKASGPRNRVRFDPLEAALLLGCIALLLPNTGPGKSLEFVFWLLFNNLGVTQAMAPSILYAIGWVLLTCLIVRYLYVHAILKVMPPELSRFVGAVTLFACRYLLDFFLSATQPFSFETCVWPFFVFAAFFIVVIYLNRAQALRLVYCIAIITGVQAVYAICSYLTGQHQYFTPHFGNRTEGTFDSPNTLYPLCLLGAPLCAVLAEVQEHRWKRVLFASAATANLIALTFTYMRSGWLGLCAAIVYLLVARRSIWSAYPCRRAVAIGLLVCTLVAIMFVRTRGELVGNSVDRSTLGRFQIWRVCLRVIKIHPWSGSGLSSYGEAQSTRMTPALEAFNPMNGEAKSLYLNMAAEFGCLGLALLVLVAWQYARMVHTTLIAVKSDSNICSVIIGTTAGVIALAAAGLTDTPTLYFDRVPGSLVLAILVGATATFARDTFPPPIPSKSIDTRRLYPLGALGLSLLLLTAIGTAISSFVLVQQSLPKMDHYVLKLQHPVPSVIASPLPAAFKNALIATEDRNFYRHRGIDWEALHSALRNDIRLQGTPQGGSTITMQAVRYILLPYDKTPIRKIAQLILAHRIEGLLPKKDILRLYTDSVGFGLHTAGLKNAARFYFAKKPEDLSLAECGFLVGVISHPPHSIQEITVPFAEQRKLSVLRHLEQAQTGEYSAETLKNARHEILHFAWEKIPNG